jgi:hypothetical protein
VGLEVPTIADVPPVAFPPAAEVPPTALVLSVPVEVPPFPTIVVPPALTLTVPPVSEVEPEAEPPFADNDVP